MVLIGCCTQAEHQRTAVHKLGKWLCKVCSSASFCWWYLCRIYYLSVTNSNATDTCIYTSQSMRTLSYLGAHRLSACSSPFPTWILGALLSVRLFCTELLLLTLTTAWAIMHIVLLELSLSTNSTVSSQKISFPFPGFKLTCSHELPTFG